MPYDASLISDIARRHGLSGDVSLLPDGGMVNEAWLIGERTMLRIVKPGQDPECDTESVREASIVPVLVEAGLTTPRLIAHGVIGAPRPYTIYERVHGETVGFSKLGYQDYGMAWQRIGRDLWQLHSVPVAEDLLGHLHQNIEPSHPKWIEKAVERGAISQETAEDITQTAEQLTLFAGPAGGPCLIHNDVHPWNLMGDPSTGRLAAILDWGDAGYGDPARDFAMMPLPCVPAMFEGYVEAGCDPRFVLPMAARSLVVGLSTALFELCTPEMAEFDQRWWRMSGGSWQAMKDTAAELWPELGLG